MKYYIRHLVHAGGKVEEIKVSKEEVDKEIKKQLEKDKEMLDILAKL